MVARKKCNRESFFEEKKEEEEEMDDRDRGKCQGRKGDNVLTVDGAIRLRVQKKLPVWEDDNAKGN